MTIIDTPVGPLSIVIDSAGRLAKLQFGAGIEPALGRGEAEDVAAQLREYFAGRRRKFDLGLAPQGTPFQIDVWNALLEIPYGATISYSELAGRIGRPKSVRAVGAANGANPIPIIIPCHRVIGANGTLTGYGGGIERKQWLLALEGQRLF
jgi:methylated-DNA-[protein]-cysteine S-methyltransferase